MTGYEYQQAAARTLLTEPDQSLSAHETMMLWTAFGLAGEAGEVVEDLKKAIFHRHGLDKDRLKKELGDVLWYVAGLCTTLGLELEDVMNANIEKLRARYPDGYSSMASQGRLEVSR